MSWSFVCASPAHTEHDRKTIQVCVKSHLSFKREFCVCGGFLSHTYSISHVPTPTWVVCVQCRLVGECFVGRTEDSPGQHAVLWGVSAGQMYHKMLANIVKTMESISMCVWELYKQEGKSGKAYTKISFLAHARVQTQLILFIYLIC